MIYGCGVDIEEINRFTKHINLFEAPPSFISDVFSEKEIAINKSYLKELRFPLGFSCKESAFKAFGISWTNSPISWKDIELVFQSNEIKDYRIALNGYAKELFDQENLKRIDSSVAFNETYVMFQIVLIK